MGPIEVITSVQRRRRWTPEGKRTLLEEAEQSGNSLSAVARKYGVNPKQFFHWRKLMREGALVAVGADENVVPASEVKQLKVQFRELERLLGKKTMEAEILRDAIRIAREKKTSVADALAQERRFPVRRSRTLLASPDRTCTRRVEIRRADVTGRTRTTPCCL